MFHCKTHTEQISHCEILFKKFLFLKLSTLAGVRSLDKFNLFDSFSDSFAKSNIIFYEFSIEDVVFKGTSQLEGLKQLIDLSIWILISPHQLNNLLVPFNNLLIIRVDLLFLTVLELEPAAVMCLNEEHLGPEYLDRLEQSLEAGHARG